MESEWDTEGQEETTIEEDLDNGGLEGHEAGFLHGYLRASTEEED